MILIAGGAGYIGAHTNKYLSKQGYRTVVFDNLSKGYKEFVRWGHFFQGDLADSAALRQCFNAHPIKAVMHFCSFIEVGESVLDPEKYYYNNVCNTLNLLSVMREFNVKHIIFSSSCAVYGEPQSLPLTETHTKNPLSPYGRTKLMIEQILADYDNAYGIKHINLRYFNAAGADPDCEIGEKHQPESHLIPLVIQAALGLRKKISIYGNDYPTRDGTCVRDYIHVLDLAAAHKLALAYLNDKQTSGSFNLGNNQGFTVLEIIRAVEAISKKTIPTEVIPRRQGDPATLIGSAELAQKTLGYKPQYADLKTIIATAWAWHKKINTEVK